MDIQKIQKRLREFARERDWEQFHTPKNLVMALTGEVGELNEVFQWREPGTPMTPIHRGQTENELADILIYVFMLADKCGIDLEKSVDAKIKLNSIKYPVSKSKGNATKYNRR